MTDEEFFTPVEEKPWTSTYNHPTKTDPRRVAKAIPKHRLTTKRGRYFTTDRSEAHLKHEMDAVIEQKKFEATASAAPSVKPKKTFTAKNG